MEAEKGRMFMDRLRCSRCLEHRRGGEGQLVAEAGDIEARL